ncbi:hypothetical protein BIV57_08660 [Mangrovactinospora gilvigrisea]|uniref:Uncharacterized protein n=1 Tax=Mangrovactinospora gilvigrisea TaxID=1428644 RepID=A0A1J7BH77_9ACTN|nr:hypothetical protein BIV57_08660 [Mangrovactinospora gilvigrisea]
MRPADPAAFGGAPDVLGAWVTPYGHTISAHYYAAVPDLPASPDDIHLLRPAMAQRYASSGCLIEADQAVVDGVRAVRMVAKQPLPGGPGHGLLFGGVLVLPRDRCSAVLKIEAPEQGVTGMREATVAARSGNPMGLFQDHPYQPGLRGALPFNEADSYEYDEEFPDHPLTVVRRVLAHLITTSAVDPQFRDLPAFGS